MSFGSSWPRNSIQRSSYTSGEYTPTLAIDQLYQTVSSLLIIHSHPELIEFLFIGAITIF
jgi:hypothetical protein